jgi:NAD(P)-dependent dehydrogenase (short-subunit alcohol dehydrogenase family)
MVTEASRRHSIGAAVCRAFASRGVDVLFTHWRPFDRQTWYADEEGPAVIEEDVRRLGAHVEGLEVDLWLVDAPRHVLETAVERLGIPSILVNNATHDPQGNRGIDTLDAAELDLKDAVNIRSVPLPSGRSSISTVDDPGGMRRSGISQPQVNFTSRSGTTSKKRPEAKPSPLTLMRNTPPGLDSRVASTPCRWSHRSVLLKNENTVAGDALM